MPVLFLRSWDVSDTKLYLFSDPARPELPAAGVR